MSDLACDMIPREALGVALGSFISLCTAPMFMAACSQLPRCGNNLRVLQWMNELKKCGLYIQGTIIQP